MVELLVVIGIIAILAGVALGPITNGIKQARESAGVQTVRSIGLAEFAFANDHDTAYPDTNVPPGNSGYDAATIARALLSGNYVTDPSTFYLSGSVETKFTGANPASNIAVSNISYDFVATGGNGLGTNYPEMFPVCWSSVFTGTEPTLTTAEGSAIICQPSATNPFGTSGVAVAFKNNSARFLTPTFGLLGSKCMMVGTNNPGNASPSVKVYPGGG